MKRMVLVLFFVITVVAKSQSSMQGQNSAPINARQDQQNYRDKNDGYPFPYIRGVRSMNFR